MSEQHSADYVFTDRYGGPANWPDPETVCKGPCEGMGVYPQRSGDDWEFVTCDECGGTGKRRFDGEGAQSG